MTRLFLYGTLKRGCKNHRHLAGQAFLGEARTAPGFLLYRLDGYPGMVEDPAGRGGVTGELWSVDDDALARLDCFEGVHEGLYRRIAVPLATPVGDVMQADAYLYARDTVGLPVIGSVWSE